MIHLRTFNLQKLDEIEHYVLIQELGRDKTVQTYIAKDFSTWLGKQKSVSEDMLEVGKSYVIERDGKYVGVVGSLNFSNDGILELWCTIKKNLRGRGYGEKVLAEITPYLIEHIDGLNDIKLKIDENNLASKKVAMRNGYIEEPGEKDKGIESYYYFGKGYFDAKDQRKKPH